MVGTQVGSWILKKLIGSGGMGRVYLAEHAVMGDLWAVKILTDELTQRPEVVARFVNEARAAAKVRHRNLIRVVTVDRVPDGPWYMVMELLEGLTLAAHLADRKTPMAPSEAVRWLSQIACALRALHAERIVHRDLKPENIFLADGSDGVRRPIVLDLGVASLGALSLGVATQRGLILGTPGYMAPEQLLGETVHPTADVYALGVIAYEMSTGWLPYQADWENRKSYFELSPAELYRRITQEPPVDPRRRNPALGDAWAHVLLRMLAPNPLTRILDAKTAVIELAKAMPLEGVTDGLEVIRRYAPELLEADNLKETLRSRGGAVLTAPAGDANVSARYALGQKLGGGGMAEVFIGTQIGEGGFERPVAIKRVLSELSAQPGFAEMFNTEARLASRLHHPNIISVIDFRRDPEGRWFLVMEYVEGRDLAALIDTGPLPVSAIIFIISEVLRGLGYAHVRADQVTGDRGMVHRDMSPHNVLLSWEGAVKVNDFGLARVRDGGGWAGSARIAGKPSYMSPEQVQGDKLDNRSDLWAVGVMLHEMLTHQRLFLGSVMEIIAQVRVRDLQPPRAIRPDVPRDVEAVAMKLLERELGKRYASAGEAISDLAKCADAPRAGRDELAALLAVRFPGHDSTGTAMHPVPPAVLVPSEETTNTASTLAGAASQSVPPSTAPRSRRTWPLWLIAAAVFAAVFAVTFSWLRPPVTTERAGREEPSSSDRSAASGAPISDAHDDVVASRAAPVDAQLRPDAAAPRPVDAAPQDAAVGDAARPVDAAVPDARVATTTEVAKVIPKPPGPRPAPPKPDTAVATKHPRPPAAPAVTSPTGGPGELVVLVQPWATIWLNDRQVGATPFRKTLPPGKYVVRLANDDLSKDETVTITVEPNKAATVRRNW